MSFRKIDPTELSGNAIDEICNKWMLLAAGTEDDFNFMTINWGMLGELWFKPAMTVYVRHSRHTFGYMENNDVFTVTCLKPGHEDALKLAGSKSGRDIDKLKESGLTKTMIDGAPTFEEAAYTLVCKKMYAQELPPENCTDMPIFEHAYDAPDYHKMYIGQIVAAYVND